MKKMFVFMFLLLSAVPAFAQLTSQQWERVKVCHRLLEGAQTKSVQEMSSDLEQSSSPEKHLQILEAVALTYSEIVQEQKIEEKDRKEWLHSMISLNMGYLQLGGSGSGDPVHRMIQRKLKDHLSPQLLKDPELFQSLE